MKKILIFLMLFSLLMLAACDGSKNATPTPDTTDAPTTEQAATESQSATETQTESEPTPVKFFQNPLSDVSAPDPCVVYHDGYYYAVYTEVFGITLYRSTSLETVVRDEKLMIHTAFSGTTCTSLWAPELHYNPATDRWYVYFSDATESFDFFSIRMMCIESKTNDPWGEYVLKGCTDPDLLAIDQTVFYDEASGTLYTAFSEFTSDRGQVITLAVMENPWTISDQRMMISYPKYGWEKKGKTEGKDERVNEGPVFLLHEGKLSLVYSASGCWSEYYCLGLIEFTGEDFSPENIMNKNNWSKKNMPIFEAANEVYGVGHCTFFQSPDGSETWIAYHGMATPDAGESNRFMYAQRITFDENNLPVIGEPISRDTEIGVPSGEK